MKKSTFAIIIALVAALCVPAVAFAALSPSPAAEPIVPAQAPKPGAQAKANPAPETPAEAEKIAAADEAPEPEAVPESGAQPAPEGQDASRA